MTALTGGRSVAALLSRGGEGLPRLDLELLLARAVGEGREFLFTHPEYELGKGEYAHFRRLCGRRARGEPFAYIAGEKEFYSLVFEVNRDVLIPRPETELLVEEAVRRRPASLLDLGTGCGNVAVAVKRHVTGLRVVASDASEAALRVARRNADRILGEHDVSFVRSEFFDRIPDEEFAVIASNPPYIKKGRIRSLQRDVRRYEPTCALDGGEDGLDAYRSILGGARSFLEPGGIVILEADPDVWDGLLRLASGLGYVVESTARDLGGAERMLVLR